MSKPFEMKVSGLILTFTLVALLGISAIAIQHDEIRNTGSDNEYTVVTVQGRILFEQSGKDMQRGDMYITGTPLEFMTPESRAAIVNEINGRFVLSNNKGALKVLPAANNVSSRRGGLVNFVDLKNHFSGRYLVLGVSKLELSETSFPMNDETFFYLTYQHDGEEIAKKLSYEGNKLIFDRDEIYKIDGNPIPVAEKEMTIYYKEKDSVRKINTFTMVFTDDAVVKEEVAVILKSFESAETWTKLAEVDSYLTDFYGKASRDNLTDWLATEFNVK